jgi:hypothetical protein
LFFLEPKADQPIQFGKPVVRIGGASFTPGYERDDSGTSYTHRFVLPAKALDRLGPGTELKIEDGGRPLIGGTDLIPRLTVMLLKTCVAARA